MADQTLSLKEAERGEDTQNEIDRAAAAFLKQKNLVRRDQLREGQRLQMEFARYGLVVPLLELMRRMGAVSLRQAQEIESMDLGKIVEYGTEASIFEVASARAPSGPSSLLSKRSVVSLGRWRDFASAAIPPGPMSLPPRSSVSSCFSRGQPASSRAPSGPSSLPPRYRWRRLVRWREEVRARMPSGQRSRHHHTGDASIAWARSAPETGTISSPAQRCSPTRRCTRGSASRCSRRWPAAPR